MSELQEPPQAYVAQAKREERKIVQDTEKAGGTVHEFNPDASPAQKAAALRSVLVLIFLADRGIDNASGPRSEERNARNRIGHRHGNAPLYPSLQWRQRLT
jgi:hypothetical protein